MGGGRRDPQAHDPAIRQARWAAEQVDGRQRLRSSPGKAAQSQPVRFCRAAAGGGRKRGSGVVQASLGAAPTLSGRGESCGHAVLI